MLTTKSCKDSTVLLFYKYTEIVDLEALKKWQTQLCTDLELQGRVSLANEGINGTLAGSSEAINEYCIALTTNENFREAHLLDPIDFKTSLTKEKILFPGLDVKIVPSICGGGEISAAPLSMGGKHLAPHEFHKAMNNKNSVLLDCRNDYEYAIGRFDGAINPGTQHFNEFADYVKENVEKWKQNDTSVLMYCTGGIRCEKASAFIRSQGLDNVSQLKGGIHRYLETFEEDAGKWKGKNFVFDSRVSMAPPALEKKDNGVIGRCFCGKPCDVLYGNRVCCCCKALVLVCDECDLLPCNVDLFCSRHERLKGVYHTNLDIYSVNELIEQNKKLLQMYEKAMANNKQLNCHKRKDRKYRQMLLQQSRKVKNRIDLILEEQKNSIEPQVLKQKTIQNERLCRSCGVSESLHDGPLGTCWGLWRSHALRYEYNNLDEESRVVAKNAREANEALRRKRKRQESVAKKRISSQRANEYFRARRDKENFAVAKRKRKEKKKLSRKRVLSARFIQRYWRRRRNSIHVTSKAKQ